MTPDPLTDALLGGFADVPVQSAHAFRASLDALARPGTIRTVQGATPPAPLSVAVGVLALTLCDVTTPVHLAGAHDCQGLRAWIAFHTGAPLVGAAQASFAIGTWEALQPVNRFAIGTPDYPDRSATLIIELPCLAATGPRLTGPGIATEARLSLPETAAFQANRSRFPMGFDCFLTSCPVATAQMAVIRRISATFKDLPGGQVLGPTFDYTHRLLDFKLAAEGGELPPAATAPATMADVAHVTGFLNRDGLIETEPVGDAILTACCDAWNALTAQPDKITSIATRWWAEQVSD